MTDDLLITGARVYTMEPDRPLASALLLRGDRILAVGDESPLERAGPGTRRVDLDGRTVVPGFIDAHLHFLMWGLSLQRIDLVDAPSLAAALGRVTEAAARPGDGWLLGRGWDQSLWPEPRMPTAADLDAVTGDRPAFLRRKCGHAGWANSAALRVAGITADTPDPAGGTIARDAAGQPTGILLEEANALIGRHLSEPTDAEAVAAVAAAQTRAHAMGITGIHNMEGAAALRAFQALRRRDAWRLRVVQQVPEADLDAAIQLGIASGLGDEWIRFGALKIFADGSLGACSAWMLEPYEGEPYEGEPYEGEPDNRGIAVLSARELHDIVGRAVAAGLAVHAHAIGDAANRHVLDAFEATRRAGLGLHLRHRVEHAQILHPDDLPRFAELDVVASMQPIHATQDMILAERHWGDRARWAYAFRSLLDRGAPLAFGSDAPVETPDVMVGLHAAVTRRRADGTPGAGGWVPSERLTVQEAVRAYTLDAARSVGDEDRVGSLAAGKAADLAILDGDIFTMDPEAIRTTAVAATLVGGAAVDDREGLFG